MAEAAAASARDTLVAAVCVDRFQAGGDAQAQLAALKLLQGYNRGSFIEKGGWAVMPDKGTASRAATSAVRRPAGGPLAVPRRGRAPSRPARDPITGSIDVDWAV